MWSAYRVKNTAIQIFGGMCSQLGVNGVLEARNDGTEYLSIEAPMGGKRSYELNVDWLESIVEGWNDKRAEWEILKDMVGQLTYASFGSTPLSELSQQDKKFFNDVSSKLFALA